MYMAWIQAAIITISLITCLQTASATTIDRMNTATFGHYTQDYQPGGIFMVFSQADSYLLSDGTSWDSGAGSHADAYSTLASVTTSGSVITYAFNTPTSGVLFRNTDFDSGDHSAQGELGLPSSLTITANVGQSFGIMRGYTEIISNDETWYGQPRFNFYSAPVGSRVYFEQTYTLPYDTFTADLFSNTFLYDESGYVDFTKVQPVPEPGTILLLFTGLAGGIVLAVWTRRDRSDRLSASF